MLHLPYIGQTRTNLLSGERLKRTQAILDDKLLKRWMIGPAVQPQCPRPFLRWGRAPAPARHPWVRLDRPNLHLLMQRRLLFFPICAVHISVCMGTQSLLESQLSVLYGSWRFPQILSYSNLAMMQRQTHFSKENLGEWHTLRTRQHLMWAGTSMVPSGVSVVLSSIRSDIQTVSWVPWSLPQTWFSMVWPLECMTHFASYTSAVRHMANTHDSTRPGVDSLEFLPRHSG